MEFIVKNSLSLLKNPSVTLKKIHEDIATALWLQLLLF